MLVSITRSQKASLTRLNHGGYRDGFFSFITETSISRPHSSPSDPSHPQAPVKILGCLIIAGNPDPPGVHNLRSAGQSQTGSRLRVEGQALVAHEVFVLRAEQSESSFGNHDQRVLRLAQELGKLFPLKLYNNSHCLDGFDVPGCGCSGCCYSCGYVSYPPPRF